MRKSYYPFCVQIEMVQGCNRDCSFCGTAGMEKKVYQMDERMLMHTAELLRNFKFDGRILLAGHGEPTIHGNLGKMVMILRRYLPKSHITLFTNGYGIFKRPQLLHEIFESGANAIMFDEYSDHLIEDDVRNLEGISRYKIERLQAGVPMFDKSKKRRVLIAPAIDAGDDSLASHKLCNHCGAGMPPLEKPMERRCTIIFRDFLIRYDGNIAICCNDFRGEYYVCNINDCMTFEEAYYHPRLEAARRRLMNNDRNFFPCNVCNEKPIREGLLPDKQGKCKMAPPSQRDIELTNKRYPALSGIRKREWEK